MRCCKGVDDGVEKARCNDVCGTLGGSGGVADGVEEGGGAAKESYCDRWGGALVWEESSCERDESRNSLESKRAVTMAKTGAECLECVHGGLSQRGVHKGTKQAGALGIVLVKAGRVGLLDNERDKGHTSMICRWQ